MGALDLECTLVTDKQLINKHEYGSYGAMYIIHSLGVADKKYECYGYGATLVIYSPEISLLWHCSLSHEYYIIAIYRQ